MSDDFLLSAIWGNLNDIFFTVNPGLPKIQEVIFNNPATIIKWKDGTKTVVKCYNEPFDEEKGFAMAYLKKLYGGRNQYMKYIKNATRQVDGKCEEN